MISMIVFQWWIWCPLLIIGVFAAQICLLRTISNYAKKDGFQEGADSVKEKQDSHKVYISWNWRDIQSLQPTWKQYQCEDALWEHAEVLQDRSVALGWEVLEDLIGRDTSEEDSKE